MASESIPDPAEYFEARRKAEELAEFNEFAEAAAAAMPEAVTPEFVAEYVRRNGQPLEGD